MSRRKRYPAKTERPVPELGNEIMQAILAQEGYPSPEERWTILQRRGEIMREVIADMLSSSGRSQEGRARTFIQKYGQRDALAVLNSLQRGFQRPSYIAEESWIYRQYRQAFARFGGERRFLSYAEHEELNGESARMEAMRSMSPVPLSPSRRLQQVRELTLTPPALWEDLLPPDTPRRPADFHAPQAAVYRGPEQELLALGWDLNLQAVDSQAARWRAAIPDLARMALDAGLLNGWPGETASWAPYYALHLLGVLKAHEYAARLMALYQRADDWLADRLPDAWGRMGAAAAPALWGLLDDGRLPPKPRGLAAMGLQALAEADPRQRLAVIRGMGERLENPAGDEKVNAYLIIVLDRMKAVEARKEIAAAFAQGRVAANIIGPQHVELLADELVALGQQIGQNWQSGQSSTEILTDMRR